MGAEFGCQEQCQDSATMRKGFGCAKGSDAQRVRMQGCVRLLVPSCVQGWGLAWPQNYPNSLLPTKEQRAAFPRSAVSWLKPPPPPERSRRPRYLTTAYWHNHGSQLAFLGGYTSLNLLLFTLAALRHAGLGGWVAVARGCGQCLNFNCAFIAVSARSWVGAQGFWGGLPIAFAIPSLPPCRC